jgi:hypothetical protein
MAETDWEDRRPIEQAVPLIGLLILLSWAVIIGIGLGISALLQTVLAQ